MEININPSDIDKYVRDVFLASTVGENLKKAIEESFSKVIDSYDSPFKRMVTKQLEEFTKDYLNEPEIRKIIHERLIKLITPDAIEKIVAHGINELNRRYKEADY